MPIGSTLDLPPFPGFRDEGLDFLRALRDHNDRDWFKPRKEVYDDELQWPLRCLVADLARRAPARGLPFTGDPKGSVFRIYRDTRFSKNKQPYKTHVSAVLTRTGDKHDDGGLYVHVKPGASHVSVGFWRMERSLLQAWRRRIVAAPAAWLGVRDTLEAAGLTLAHGGDTLKRLPRGFEDPGDEAAADFLKWKSFYVEQPVTDAQVQTPDFTELILDVAERARPLLTFGWEAGA